MTATEGAPHRSFPFLSPAFLGAPMKNVGKTDAAIRYVLAGLCLLAPLVLEVSPAVRVGLYVATVALVVTASIGFCGAYRILGISTCALKEKSPK